MRKVEVLPGDKTLNKFSRRKGREIERFLEDNSIFQGCFEEWEITEHV